MEIQSLVLHTNDIQEMKKFYLDLLQFPLVNEDKDSFCIKVGTSQLVFTSKNVKGNPYYHFAFNIPSNQFSEAKAWVKERVELSLEDGSDEVYFENFLAHALYFYDPAGNIVEFIARGSIPVEATEPFSSASIINISEIGLTVDDAIRVGSELIDNGIPIRDNRPLSTTSLNFMGENANGIFIILNQPGRRWIFSDKLSAVFPIEIKTGTDVSILVNSDSEVEVYKN
ncbi:VOC family protein [Ornithinibacillus contaminans]|uniref:VOC family protein n=1 Tax=Ornithinibacillus contaminans TaxID=694055 RepID=UPI00064DAB82|nr:VOC family protein [Ornithinibacillus contaminans]